MLGSGSAINLSSHRICCVARIWNSCQHDRVQRYLDAALFPYPDADCSGKTVIVTGSNTGLGKEAVRHFVRLKAKKVIVAVLSIAKGEAARADIEADTKNPGVIEVWELDYSSYASVKAFPAKAATLDLIDGFECRTCHGEIRDIRG